MFSSKSRKESNSSKNALVAQEEPRLAKSDVPSIIASDLKIIGDLLSHGSIEIEGMVEGNITCEQVTVRQSGRVHGDVVAQNVQIDGEVSGLVKGKQISLSETGRVSGVIIYESLAVQDGAAIDGQCKYVSSIDSIADVSVVASTAAAIISASDSAAYSHAVLHVDASS